MKLHLVKFFESIASSQERVALEDEINKWAVETGAKIQNISLTSFTQKVDGGPPGIPVRIDITKVVAAVSYEIEVEKSDKAELSPPPSSRNARY